MPARVSAAVIGNAAKLLWMLVIIA